MIADILLAADVKDTRVEVGDIPDFTIDETTYQLPQIKGTGLVYDSFILANIDENFKAVAQDLNNGDRSTVISGFNNYIEHYSGYTQLIIEMQARYSVESFEMAELDKQAWILERFDASNENTPRIEAYYSDNLNRGQTPARAIMNNEQQRIQTDYQALAGRLESTFSLQSIFSETLSAMDYDLDTNRFVVNDVTALQNQAINHFNSADQTPEQKLYLAEMMQYQMQYNGLEFDVNAIVNAIEDNVTQVLVRDIYLGKGVRFLQSETYESGNGVVMGSEANEFLETGDGDHQILLGKGDDKVIGGNGSQIYYFGAGDGLDVIFDRGGIDLSGVKNQLSVLAA